MHDAIEFVETDVTALQFDEARFDLCVTYNGRHCLPDPRAARAVRNLDLGSGDATDGRNLGPYRHDRLASATAQIATTAHTAHTASSGGL